MTFLLAFAFLICFLLAPAGWVLAPSEPVGAELVTHLFTHRDLEHLAANTVTLLGFGFVFERRRGPIETLALFLVAGSFAGAIECAADPTFPGAILGASGGVAAFLGAFARFERWAWLIVLPVLALFSFEALNPAGPNADWAHLSGFFVGLQWALLAPARQPADTRLSNSQHSAIQ